MSDISDIAESARNLTDFTNGAATLAKMLLATAKRAEPIDADRWDEHLEVMLDKLPDAINALHAYGGMSVDEATKAAHRLYRKYVSAPQLLAAGTPIKKIVGALSRAHLPVMMATDRIERRLRRMQGDSQQAMTPLTQPQPRTAGAGETAEAPPEPKKLLNCWREITAALGMKYADRRNIKYLNDRRDGPIRNTGPGTRPMVNENELVAWWNRLAAIQQELANERTGARLSAEAQHNYGRNGTVAPEIGGHVKQRRSDRRA